MDLDPMLLHCITSLLYPLHLWGILKSISKKKGKRNRNRKGEKIFYTKNALISKKKKKRTKQKCVKRLYGSPQMKHCIHIILHVMVPHQKLIGVPFISDSCLI